MEHKDNNNDQDDQIMQAYVPNDKEDLPPDDNIINNKDKDLSVEEVEEEDNAYIDEALYDPEEDELGGTCQIEVEKENEECTVNASSYTKEFDNFTADGEIYSIALCNDKGIAVIGDGEDTTYFYDIGKKELIKKEKFNTDSVNCIKFSHDEKYFATASLDGSALIFDSTTFEILNKVNGSFSDINWLDWHPKGPVIAFGSIDGSVWVYHAVNTNNQMSFFGHTQSASCGCFSKDGKYLLSGSDDCSIKVWDLKSQKLFHTIKGRKFHKAPITCMCVANSKSISASGSVENEVSIANYENGSILHTFSAGAKNFAVEAIQFCNEDMFIIFADSECYVKIFNLSNLQVRSKIAFDAENITKIIPSSLNNYTLYMSGSNGHFYVLDIRADGVICQKEKSHSDVIIDFLITRDENYALTSSLDKTINLVKIIKLE